LQAKSEDKSARLGFVKDLGIEPLVEVNIE
jgi:hypothetical protein